MATFAIYPDSPSTDGLAEFFRGRGWYTADPVTAESIDGLVLVAVSGSSASVSGCSDEQWDGMVYRAVIDLHNAAVAARPALRRGVGKRIVVVCGASALWPQKATAVDSVGARMAHWLAQMLAIEFTADGISVNSVLQSDIDAIPPSGRRTSIEDVAYAIEFFLSPAAQQYVGAALVVDGGMLASGRSWSVRNS